MCPLLQLAIKLKNEDERITAITGSRPQKGFQERCRFPAAAQSRPSAILTILRNCGRGGLSLRNSYKMAYSREHNAM